MFLLLPSQGNVTQCSVCDNLSLSRFSTAWWVRWRRADTQIRTIIDYCSSSKEPLDAEMLLLEAILRSVLRLYREEVPRPLDELESLQQSWDHTSV